MTAYYNENDPFAAQWLRNLAAVGRIPAGLVDDRPIQQLCAESIPNDATQAHFFAGIGGWAYALELAGWPADAPVWTGSCPCQPFSVAGKRGGFDDEKHLWPVWFDLIKKCRPPVVFGEQVSSADGLRWFDLVSADLESEGYAVGAADLCAAGVGAPHLRQRLYWVAYAGRQRFDRERLRLQSWKSRHRGVEIGGGSETMRAPHDLWTNPEWIGGRDGWRRSAEPGTFPVAYGISGRLERRRANGILKGYGNAIVPQVASQFVRAFMEVISD